jgi:hypothetical protein
MISADEKFVREHWVGQDPIEVLVVDDPMPEFCSASVRIRGFGPCFYRSTQEEAWSAAAEYTRNRIEEIREVEEEMMLLRSMVILLDSEPGDLTAPIYRRTITRLQSALVELKRGMK